MNRQRLYTIIKVGVTVCLMAFLLSMVNWAVLVEALKSANILYLVAAQVLVFAQVVVGAYRWKILLSPKGINVPLHSLTSFYFIGSFFNRFLPTVLGGDVMRGYELARFSGRVIDSATSVMMERLLGFLCLFVICWISLPFAFHMLEGTNVLLWVGAMSIGFLLFLGVLLSTRLTTRILSLARIINKWNVEIRLKEAYESLHSFVTSRSVLLKAFVVSVVYQLVAIVSIFLISQSLSLGVSFVYFLVAVPIIWVIMMVPISIGGLGVREGIFVLLLTQQGASTEEALLLSFLFFGLTLIIGLVGGVLYAWRGYRQHAFQSADD